MHHNSFHHHIHNWQSKGTQLGFIDKAAYLVGLAGLVMTLPQLFKVWFERQTAGLSVLTWGSYFIFSIFWLVYGVKHKEKPLILTNGLWVIMNFLIFLGLLIF